MSDPEMPPAPQTGAASGPSEAEAFYVNAYERIKKSLIVLLAVLTMAAWGRFGRWVALSFLLGGSIAAINFIWLKRLVVAFAERAIESQGRRSGGGLVSRFLLRYGLVAVGAYVIFKSSALSLYGLFAGLFLPAAAILCEAAYELYVSLRRGI